MERKVQPRENVKIIRFHGLICQVKTKSCPPLGFAGRTGLGENPETERGWCMGFRLKEFGSSS